MEGITATILETRNPGTLVRPSRLRVSVETGDAFELLTSLLVMTDAAARPALELGRDWFRAMRRRAGTDLMARISSFAGGAPEVWLAAVGVALDAPPPRDAAAFFGELEATEPDELVRTVLGFHSRTTRRVVSPETLLEAAGGDRAAQREMRRLLWPEDRAFQAGLRAVFATPAEDLKHELGSVARAWYERAWCEEGERNRGPIARDAEAKRSLVGTMAPESFIELVTNGVTYLPEPGITSIVAVPSIVLRPLVTSREHRNEMAFVYSVADEALETRGGRPPLRLVRQMRAVADETRLEVLHALRDGHLGTRELVDRIGVPRTTLLHHLMILRSAGFIRVIDGPAGMSYELRDEGWRGLPDLLGRYLAPDA